MFFNPVSQHQYAPYNMQALAAAQARGGWQSPEFAGFHQWIKAGRVVKKGEKGTPVVFFVEKKIPNSEPVKVRKVKFVFNIEQTQELQREAVE